MEEREWREHPRGSTLPQGLVDKSSCSLTLTLRHEKEADPRNVVQQIKCRRAGFSLFFYKGPDSLQIPLGLANCVASTTASAALQP